MNGLPLVPVRREGMSLSMLQFLPILTLFSPNFQGLFSLSLSAILVLSPEKTGLFGALRWQKEPLFP